MGSLTSRPKVPQAVQSPSAPQIVYVQSSVSSDQDKAASITPPAAPAAPKENNNGGGVSTPVQGNNESAVRINDLLRRGRGISGTIQTGFRGLLSANDLIPARKTLLGE